MAIFLSYSRKDEAVVKELAEGIEAAKQQVWFDHDLGGGDAWWDSILAHIRESTLFLFALSDAAIHSKPCRLELEYAIALARPILPVRVGPVTSYRTGPLPEYQVIPFRPDEARSGFAVLAAAYELAGRLPPLPDPLPPPPPIPFGYLLALGRQIESTELSHSDQIAAVDQLRRALNEETDESVRRDIFSILQNMQGKPWRTMHVEREIAALLYAHGPRTQIPDEVPAAGPALDDEQLAEQETTPTPAPTAASEDDFVWFQDHLKKVQEQREAATVESPENPPPWKLHDDAGSRWLFGAPPVRPRGPQQTPQPPQDTFRRPPPPPPPSAAAPVKRPPASGSPAPSPPAAAPIGPPSAVPSAHWALSVIGVPGLFGVVAIYFSAQVGRRLRARDIDGAERASRTAKAWAITGIVVGIVAVVVALV